MKIKFEHWLLFVGFYQSCLTSVKCNSTWLTALPDSQRLDTISFIGTHDSATYKVKFPLHVRTQSMTITEQLEAGIRVFDIRVRLIENIFAVHHERIYLKMMFGDIINEINAFVTSNPKEFVIMFMQEEWYRENTDMDECQILERYIEQYTDLFVQYWSFTDAIGQHRGKILLSRAHRGFFTCTNWMLFCEEQNNWEMSLYYTKYNKWKDIKNLQDEIFESEEDRLPCYINYLSGNGIFYLPSQVCCKSRVPMNPDFGMLVEELGMNDKMVDYFRNPKNTMYIVMADFPSIQLIQKIVNSNFE